MYFGPPVTGDAQKKLSHVGRAVFYFRRAIKSTTEYYLYELVSLLAEIGGVFSWWMLINTISFNIM